MLQNMWYCFSSPLKKSAHRKSGYIDLEPVLTRKYQLYHIVDKIIQDKMVPIGGLDFIHNPYDIDEPVNIIV